MNKTYPMEFSLENGTKVIVNKTGSHTYEFNLREEDGPNRQFQFVDDETFTTEVEADMDPEFLDAVRRFWLEQGPLAEEIE